MPQLGAQQVADLVDEYGGAVLVVDGQPGYHASTCQDLPELGVEEIDVLLAREDGFTRCRTCRPDLVLAKRAQLEQAAFQAKQDEPSRAVPPALATAEAPRAIVVPTQARPPVAAPVAPAPLLPMRSEQVAPVGKQFVFDGGAGPEHDRGYGFVDTMYGQRLRRMTDTDPKPGTPSWSRLLPSLLHSESPSTSATSSASRSLESMTTGSSCSTERRGCLRN